MQWWVYVIIFIVTQLAGGVAGGCLNLIEIHFGLDIQNSVSLALLTSNVLAVVLALSLRPAGLTWKHTLEGWTRPERRCYTIKALLMAPPTIFIVNIVGEWLPTPPDIVGSETMFVLMNSGIGILTVGLLGPISEELLFRAGVMGRSLQKSEELQESEQAPSNHRKLIILSALLFSLVHLNPVQMPVAFILGLLLGWAYAGSRSLLAPCAIHIFNNSIAAVLTIIYKNPDVTITQILGSRTTVGITVVIAVFWLAACIFMLPTSKKMK
ncbi:MAG: CPBP family intramembrane metalloprotease [Bacteroidaceae bacterium]|nr:CPBP family intramembrane metalloprotease [Bacteroidaceae bacterium]